MNIVDAIRKMCEEKNGFRKLFNKALSYGKLCSLVDDKKNLFKLKLMPVFEPDIPSALKL